MEGTSNSAAAQLRNYGVGLILGLAAVGYVQAASTLMGPFMVILYGMGLVALPEAARVLNRSPRHLTLFCVLLSVGLTLPALAWGVALLVMLPRGVGAGLLGPLWLPTYPLVLPTTLFIMGVCASSGAGTGLHALGAARRSLRAAALTSAIYVVGALIGAVTGGAVGTMRGAAVATWMGALLYWWQLRAALAESDSVPPGNRLWFRHRAARHRNRRLGLDLYRRKPDARPRRRLDTCYFRIPDSPQPPAQLEAILRQRRDRPRPPAPWLMPPDPLVRRRRAYPQPQQPPRPGESHDA
jgi:hypothetical protein